MNDIITNSLTVLFGFLAIMNPIANTPIFIGLTEGDDNLIKKKVAFRALFLTFVIILAFILLGNIIFELFGITIGAFKITGGILIFAVGLKMMHGESSKIQHPGNVDQAEKKENQLSVAVSPLALPILAGPGTIATAMNFSSSRETVDIIITIGAFFLTCLITYVFFIAGNKIIKYIGDSGVKVVTRLMGMILAVIGTQMVIEGIESVNELFKY
jgi:multiple antibiotic resistance protein